MAVVSKLSTILYLYGFPCNMSSVLPLYVDIIDHCMTGHYNDDTCDIEEESETGLFKQETRTKCSEGVCCVQCS